MDSDWMDGMAAALAGAGVRTLRFEFAYMAARRTGAPARPPPRAEALAGEYRAAVAAARSAGPLLIGGKSMGGRVASLVADELFAAGRIAGLVCLGYPFHPPGRPERLRTAHLATLHAPALICQGERDPFGTRADVAGYRLSPAVTPVFLPDGDHDLRPRRASGHTHAGNLAAAARHVAAFAAAQRA
ncbi:alpha/beta hydrolase [Aquibium sp. A9E412]|nr:alpha/beta family hydrolase [Aquibium sp. A9E412]MDN2567812.1 alpha/beta hydrolase [Aquibium sp. A9E412]